MKKTTFITGSTILIILISIVAVFANFYAPLISSNDTEFSVNVAEPKYQTIYADKKRGVTKLVNACFATTKIDNNYARIDDIYLTQTRLSGLIDYGFIYAKYVKASDDSEKDKIKFIMSPFGKDTIAVDLSDSLGHFNINEPNELISEAIYLPFFKSIDQECINKQGIIINEECKKDIYVILNEDGRICNFNCIHE